MHVKQNTCFFLFTLYLIRNINGTKYWISNVKGKKYLMSNESKTTNDFEDIEAGTNIQDRNGKNTPITNPNDKDEGKKNKKEGDFCGGEWDYPKGCNLAGRECEYFARWQFQEDTDNINFTIISRNTDGGKKWTGIGFSKSPSMSHTDAIIGWVEPNGKHTIMDMWTESYLDPILDPSQDISEMSGKLENGKTTLKFSRKRKTGDKDRDVAFTDAEGLYFIFPVKGGTYTKEDKKIRKHQQTPMASSEKIFIKNCRTPDGKLTSTTTAKPKLAVGVDLHPDLKGSEMITREITEKVLAAAVAEAKKIGARVSIAVMDSGAHLTGFIRMDGTLLSSVDISIKKAKTAVLFDMETEALGALAQPGKVVYAIEHSNDGLVTFLGGVPLRTKAGGSYSLAGGIGVSGTSVMNDKPVAEAGLAEFQRLMADVDKN